jgi:hypothetical protein
VWDLVPPFQDVTEDTYKLLNQERTHFIVEDVKELSAKYSRQLQSCNKMRKVAGENEGEAGWFTFG